MSSNEIRHGLRKYEFPGCAKEALIKIDQIFTATNHGPSNKQLDLAMDIISEFIFCEPDRRAGRRGCIFNSLQELQLTMVLIEYLRTCDNETARNSIFLLLFGGAESQRRLKILYLLSTMSITNNVTPILSSVGVWLQQTGCSSLQSLELTERLVIDQFSLSFPKSYLKSFARKIPAFVANFMTSVTEVYFRERNGKVKIPPRNLLDIITFWVFNYPEICMAAQIKHAALPTGAIPMAAVNPLAGLINYCSLSALYVEPENKENIIPIPVPVPPVKIKAEPIPEDDPDYISAKRIKTEELSVFLKYELPELSPIPAAKEINSDDDDEELEPPIVVTPETQEETYSKLLFAIINSLRVSKTRICPPIAVNAQHLLMMVPAIQNFAKRLIEKRESVHENPRLEECTERMAQLIQMALTYNCVFGNINNLLATLKTLPDYRALRMVITHQEEVMRG